MKRIEKVTATVTVKADSLEEARRKVDEGEWVKHSFRHNVEYRYIAVDGTEFSDEEECIKYEKTCKCVLHTEYMKRVVGRIAEDELFFNGSCDYDYDIVRINSDEDAEAVCKRLAYGYVYKDAFEKVRNAVGGYALISREYDGDDLDGYVTTLSELMQAMSDHFYEAIERGLEKN